TIPVTSLLGASVPRGQRLVSCRGQSGGSAQTKGSGRRTRSARAYCVPTPFSGRMVRRRSARLGQQGALLVRGQRPVADGDLEDRPPDFLATPAVTLGLVGPVLVAEAGAGPGVPPFVLDGDQVAGLREFTARPLDDAEVPALVLLLVGAVPPEAGVGVGLVAAAQLIGTQQQDQERAGVHAPQAQVAELLRRIPQF